MPMDSRETALSGGFSIFFLLIMLHFDLLYLFYNLNEYEWFFTVKDLVFVSQNLYEFNKWK